MRKSLLAKFAVDQQVSKAYLQITRPKWDPASVANIETQHS
jgi:hypothetical protein